jgi:hypothetical protein
MSVFKFRDSEGQIFQVVGPPGATEAEALAIFQKQYQTGSLIGLSPGEVVNAATQAAGGLATAQSQVTATTQLTALKLPDLQKVQLINAIDIARYIKDGVSGAVIGALTPEQIRGLTAQAAAAANQSYTAITVEKGVGKFGFNPQQLEYYGLLKPGTSATITKTPSLYLSTLQSPTVWTGKEGITSLNVFLSNETVQNKVQLYSMENNYEYLKQLGIITGSETTKIVGTLVQVATKYGATLAAAWAKGKATPAQSDQINITAKQALYAIGFSGLSIVTFANNTTQSTGYVDTVNRATLDFATTQIIGSPKIPSPNYTGS